MSPFARFLCYVVAALMAVTPALISAAPDSPPGIVTLADLPPAEEEVPSTEVPDAVEKEAILGGALGLVQAGTLVRYQIEHETVPEPPHDGQPTPPPDAC